MLADELLDRIYDGFLEEFGVDANSEEIAVFIRHESEGHLHCEVKAYFSPACVVVASAFDAEPCGRPTPIGLSLLVGSEGSWAVLFPDHKR